MQRFEGAGRAADCLEARLEGRRDREVAKRPLSSPDLIQQSTQRRHPSFAERDVRLGPRVMHCGGSRFATSSLSSAQSQIQPIDAEGCRPGNKSSNSTGRWIGVFLEAARERTTNQPALACALSAEAAAKLVNLSWLNDVPIWPRWFPGCWSARRYRRRCQSARNLAPQSASNIPRRATDPLSEAPGVPTKDASPPLEWANIPPDRWERRDEAHAAITWSGRSLGGTCHGGSRPSGSDVHTRSTAFNVSLDQRRGNDRRAGSSSNDGNR